MNGANNIGSVRTVGTTGQEEAPVPMVSTNSHCFPCSLEQTLLARMWQFDSRSACALAVWECAVPLGQALFEFGLVLTWRRALRLRQELRSDARKNLNPIC
jgi:hypothetical protein